MFLLFKNIDSTKITALNPIFLLKIWAQNWTSEYPCYLRLAKICSWLSQNCNPLPPFSAQFW